MNEWCHLSLYILHSFLIIHEPDAQISQIYFGMKLYVFWTVPPSIIRSFSLYTQQWYMSYGFADSLRAGSGWFHPDPARKLSANLYDIYHCYQNGSILILLASCQQTCMTYTIAIRMVPSWSCSQAVSKPVWHTTAVCTVKNSWWWTEELSETCRVSFQNKFVKFVHLVGFIIGNMSCCMVTWTSNPSLSESVLVLYHFWNNSDTQNLQPILHLSSSDNTWQVNIFYRILTGFSLDTE